MLDICLYTCKHMNLLYNVHKLYFGFIIQPTYIFRMTISMYILSLVYWTHRIARMVLKHSLVTDPFKIFIKLWMLSVILHSKYNHSLTILIEFQMICWSPTAPSRLNKSIFFLSF